VEGAASGVTYAAPDLYDLMYHDFRADIGFHVADAKKANGPVLEVCCGNGRLTVPMAEAGVDLDGLDLDAGLLADLERKLAARGLKAGLHQGDMREFTMPRRYALVLIPFNSFYHNLTQTDQLATLRCCREHLDHEGRLCLIAYHPSAKILAADDGARVLWKEVPEGEGVARIFNQMTVDRVEQVQRIHRWIERVDASGRVTQTHEYDFRLRYAGKPEMELLLKTAGYSRWEVCTPFEKYEADTYYDPPRPPVDGGPLAWSAWRH